MVRDCRNGYGQKNNRCEQDSDLVFHRPSIILNNPASLYRRFFLSNIETY